MAKARICDLCELNGRFVQAICTAGRKEKIGGNLRKFTLDLCIEHKEFFAGAKSVDECVKRYHDLRNEKLAL